MAEFGCIYWIRAQTVGHIKIGFSKNPVRRFEQLQLMSPVPLQIVGLDIGTQDQERALHARLHAHRLHGEWFRACDEVFDTIVAFPTDPDSISEWVVQRTQVHPEIFTDVDAVVDLLKTLTALKTNT